jgi:hypothetical protein
VNNIVAPPKNGFCNESSGLTVRLELFTGRKPPEAQPLDWEVVPPPEFPDHLLAKIPKCGLLPSPKAPSACCPCHADGMGSLIKRGECSANATACRCCEVSDTTWMMQRIF